MRRQYGHCFLGGGLLGLTVLSSAGPFLLGSFFPIRLEEIDARSLAERNEGIEEVDREVEDRLRRRRQSHGAVHDGSAQSAGADGAGI